MQALIEVLRNFTHVFILVACKTKRGNAEKASFFRGALAIVIWSPCNVLWVIDVKLFTFSKASTRCTPLQTFQEQDGLSGGNLKNTRHCINRVRTLFQKQISRTQIDFSRALKFTITPTLPRSQR